jgi:hypothetical protein
MTYCVRFNELKYVTASLWGYALWWSGERMNPSTFCNSVSHRHLGTWSAWQVFMHNAVITKMPNFVIRRLNWLLCVFQDCTSEVEVWHRDVKFFKLFNKNGKSAWGDKAKMVTTTSTCILYISMLPSPTSRSLVAAPHHLPLSSYTLLIGWFEVGQWWILAEDGGT